MSEQMRDNVCTKASPSEHFVLAVLSWPPGETDGTFFLIFITLALCAPVPDEHLRIRSPNLFHFAICPPARVQLAACLPW